jgi:hypothetical protein
VQVDAGGDGHGEILFFSYELMHNEYMSECTFHELQTDSATHSIRGSSSCTSLDPIGTTGSCSVGTSYFAIEHCKEVN